MENVLGADQIRISPETGNTSAQEEKKFANGDGDTGKRENSIPKTATTKEDSLFDECLSIHSFLLICHLQNQVYY